MHADEGETAPLLSRIAGLQTKYATSHTLFYSTYIEGQNLGS